MGLPIGDVDQPSGLYTGDGEFNFVGDLAFGRSFQRVPIYVTGGVGYNLRTQGFSDEFRYTLEAGWSIGNFLAILRVRGIESLENGDSDVLGMTLGNNQSYIAYGPEVAYKFTKTFGVSAGLDTAKRIRNTISGPTYNFGVYAEL